MAGYFREQRLTSRHKLTFPVKYRVRKSESPEYAGESLDISEGGICFVTHSLLEEGETIEIRFEMPEEVVDEPAAEWRCTGRVLKVERLGAGATFHVRVRFDCYEVARQNGTTTIRLDLNSLRFVS
jgi:c-di-GMP-binding flagellar brake protein YcgR